MPHPFQGWRKICKDQTVKRARWVKILSGGTKKLDRYGGWIKVNF